MEKREPPKGFLRKTKKTWNEQQDTFEMIPSDYPVFEVGLKALDDAERLEKQIKRDGYIITVNGKKRVHPGINALKEFRLTFLRAWKLLGFPTAFGDDEKVNHLGFGRPTNLTKARRQ